MKNIILVLLLLTVSANAAQIFTTDKQKEELANAYIENIKDHTKFPVQIDRITLLRDITYDFDYKGYKYIVNAIELDLSAILQSSNKLKTKKEHKKLQNSMIKKTTPAIIEKTCTSDILVKLMRTGLRIENWYKWVDIQQNVTNTTTFRITVSYETCVENGYIKSEKK